MPNLFEPLQAGELHLPNRVIMAPLTRCRAGEGRVPGPLAREYYVQRASAGLILTEATSVDPMGVGYPDTPGIWSSDQVEGWKAITAAVHEAGGRSKSLPSRCITPAWRFWMRQPGNRCWNFPWKALNWPVSALLSIDGRLQPGNVGTFTVSLKELDLPSFDSYASKAGASLKAGQLSLEMKLKTLGPAMQMANDAVLQKLGITLSNPSSFSKYFGMPIGLAIALLSDPSGNIRLNVPVTVDGKSAHVAPGPIMASAIQAALIGAISTPLKLMGASLGGTSDNEGLVVPPLKSPPGSADLSPEASARLRDVAGLLAQRPAMAVVLRGRVSNDETPMIARQILVETIQSDKTLPALEGVGFLGRHRMEKILERQGEGRPEKLADKDQALLEKYLAVTDVPGDRLDALAKSRAETALSLLVANKVSADRIRIGDREASGAPGVVLSYVPREASMPAKKSKKD